MCVYISCIGENDKYLFYCRTKISENLSTENRTQYFMHKSNPCFEDNLLLTESNVFMRFLFSFFCKPPNPTSTILMGINVGQASWLQKLVNLHKIATEYFLHFSASHIIEEHHTKSLPTLN